MTNLNDIETILIYRQEKAKQAITISFFKNIRKIFPKRGMGLDLLLTATRLLTKVLTASK